MLTREEILGDMFYAGTLGYYAQLMAMGHIAALNQKANASVSAGYGTLGYEPKVNYFFGLPTAIESGGIVLDIPWSMVSHVSDGDKEKRKQYNLQWGLIGSALEHAVPEQMFQSQDANDPKPNAISAVKAIQMAGAAGQRIYQITRANMDTALPNIHHDGKGEIQAALQAGMTVITHTDSVSVPGWTGGGYIILDPEDNTGAYKISGGSNGGLIVFGAIFALMGALMFVMVLSAASTYAAAIPGGLGLIGFALLISGMMVAAGASLFAAAYFLSEGNVVGCNVAISSAASFIAGIEYALVGLRFPSLATVLSAVFIPLVETAGVFLGMDICTL